MPITPHSGPLSASADVRADVLGFVGDFVCSVFWFVAQLRSALGFSGRSRAGNINLRWDFACVSFFFCMCCCYPMCLLCFIFYLCCPLACRARWYRAGFIPTLCKTACVT